MTGDPEIIGARIDILGITPGTAENPILLTVSFHTPDGKRVVAVKGMSLAQADNLQAQLGWSIMDWTETHKEGGVAH